MGRFAPFAVWFVFSGALFGPVALSAQGPGERETRLSLSRYLEMEGVGDVRLSPDARRVVYRRSWVDPMNDRRESGLYVVNADGSGERFLVDGGSPRWSPSGDRLLFLACGTPGGEPGAREDCPEGAHRQVWVRTMEGEGSGSVTQVTRLTGDAANPSWSPDGERIAFTRFVASGEAWSVPLPEKPDGAAWTADPPVVDDVWWRRDRQGFLEAGFDHAFVVPATGGTPRRVTPELHDHEDIYGGEPPEWSPDGEWIYFDGLRDPDADFRWTTRGYGHMETEIFRVGVSTGEVQRLTQRSGTDRAPKVSPDGRLVAYTGVDSTGATYVADDLYVMEADGSDPRSLTPDFDRAPGDVTWAPDGRGVYFTAGDHGSENLYLADLDGGVRQVTEGDHVLDLEDVAPDGTAATIVSRPHLPEDVFLLDVDHPAELRRLTRVNDDVLDGVELGAVEEVTFASEGWEIQGWVVKPPDFDPSRRYPLILSIHGGPHAMYDVGFSYSFQNWAANGFAVLYLNPRGSTGYGSDFGNELLYDWPGPDYRDLMAGVDAILEEEWVDADNLFVTGCSGGGILTSWTVGHTDRFRGAVARCPIANWISFVGTVDGPYWYNWFEEYPWIDASEHLRRSPLMYAEEVTTPTLFMTGVRDLRTPISQTEELYQALKMEGVPTKMIRMVDEWHGTTSNPSNFLRTQRYVMKWFREHMGSKMARSMEERRVDP